MVILGNERRLSEAKPLSAEEMDHLHAAITELVRGGVPDEFNLVFVFRDVLRIVKTLHKLSSWEARLASAKGTEAEADTVNAVLAELRETLRRGNPFGPGEVGQIAIALMPPLNMAIPGQPGVGFGNPAKLITP